MDEKFTQDLQAWLDTEREKRDISVGATMLLQLNRNRILFETIIRRPEKMHDKLEYELKKHLLIRLKGYTLRQVAQMEEEVVPRVERLIMEQTVQDGTTPEGDDLQPQYHGKRDDHDKLPEEIQKLWEENAGLYFKVKELYYRLLQIQDAPVCDRFELLKPLADADKKYRENLEAYDHYELEEVSAAAASEDEILATSENEKNKVKKPRKKSAEKAN